MASSKSVSIIVQRRPAKIAQRGRNGTVYEMTTQREKGSFGYILELTNQRHRSILTIISNMPFSA